MFKKRKEEEEARLKCPDCGRPPSKAVCHTSHDIVVVGPFCYQVNTLRPFSIAQQEGCKVKAPAWHRTVMKSAPIVRDTTLSESII